MGNNATATVSPARDNMVLCQNSEGFEVRGTLVRLTRYLIVFEAYTSHPILRTSEVLSDFKIILIDRLVYSGRAVISNLVNTGSLIICEATLEDAWQDVDFSSFEGRGLGLRDEYNGFMQEWQKFYRVARDYKILIADMQTFLTDLRLWMNQVELGIRSSPSADRSQMEKDLAHELDQSVVSSIDSLWDRFEPIAETIEEDLRPTHRAYLRRQLHPLLLCSPFAYRAVRKPLGYAGDYEMINMIVRDSHEGSSLFAKMINSWLLRQPPSEAHRNRIEYLTQKITEETVRVVHKGRAARILSLGCGPAIEVQRFLQAKDFSDRTDFTLLDFNEETIGYTSKVLDDVKRKYHRTSPVQLVKKAVYQILKESGKVVERPPGSQYDFVYCAGLFDYLTDEVCRRLMNILYDWVAPGGLLLATNVSTSNSFGHSLDYILEWNLIFRSGKQAQDLAPDAVPRGSASVVSDFTGVNLFTEIRKPKDV
jgi:extracellular factor (EF) 3-hydroxypalmitic acid methyl ester biosynthesis protein